MTLRLTRFGTRFRRKVLAQLLSNNLGAPLAQYLRDGATFYAPRTSTITQSRGAGTPTETRATVATVTNNDGYLVTALSGELREEGARRVRNLLTASENILDASFNGNTTATRNNATTATAAANNQFVGATLSSTPAGDFVAQVKITRVSGVGAIQLSADAGASYTTVDVTTTPAVFSVVKLGAAANSVAPVVRITTSGDSVKVEQWQLEDVTAQTTQTAGEYVSVGVLSSPFHGAGVDGVRYFGVDISGAPIPAATTKGALVEAEATQYLGVTGTPATQTTASLGTGTYTLWVDAPGSGSCNLSAGTATISAPGAAENNTPYTFTVTGAGTVTATVVGVLTRFNLTNTPYETSYIENTGAVGTSATRNKDVLDDQVASNLTAAAGTVAFTWTPSHDPSGTIALCGSYVDASNYTVLLHDATKYIWRKRIAGVNYDAELTAAYANGTSAKIALTLGASGINLAVDGTLGTAHANTDDAQLGTRWQWGADGNSLQQAGAAFKEMYLTPRTMSDAELQALTK